MTITQRLQSCAGTRRQLAVSQHSKRVVFSRHAVAQASTRNGVINLPALTPLDADYENAHAFTAYANWLIPGRVMLGRYPYVEPSRCLSRSQGERQLSQLLEAGINTFISLQEEVPPQQQMRLAGANGFLPYKSTAELILSAMNGPPPLDITEGLRNPILDRFLPPRTRKPKLGADDRERLPDLQFLHNPIVDLGVPTQQQVQDLVLDLELRVAAGENLYIHCWGGRGRAGTVGACLLATLYNLTAEEALVRVQRAFDTRCDGGRKSPETQQQYEFVRQYVAALAATQA